MIRLKAGVSLRDLQPQVVLGLMLVEQAFAAAGAECIVTSVNDGQHKADSFHYRGLAADLRIKHIHPDRKAAVVAHMTNLLGPEWDVLWESQGLANEHVHIEFDQA